MSEIYDSEPWTDPARGDPPPSAAPQPVPPRSPSAEERQWAMLAHVTTLLGYVVAFGHVIPPLVILLSKRDESAFGADQARESLNFQITVLIAFLVALPLVCVLVGIPLLVLLALAHVVLTIVAAIAASDGRRYRYPFALRLVR